VFGLSARRHDLAARRDTGILGRLNGKTVHHHQGLTILLIEGPQDKKGSLNLYYGQYRARFPFEAEVKARLDAYIKWILAALPKFKHTRYRKPTDLYGLIGALEKVSRSGKRLRRIDAKTAGAALSQFEAETHKKQPSRQAALYVVAASRQTDNISPRNARIEILSRLLT